MLNRNNYSSASGQMILPEEQKQPSLAVRVSATLGMRYEDRFGSALFG